MANDGTKATPVPGIIDLKKFSGSRLPEIQSLQAVVGNRLNNDFCSQRTKRRRTTSFDDRVARNKFRKRRKFPVSDKSDALDLRKDGKKIPRRIRRRAEFRKNPVVGYCATGDGTRRLRTHVWHAKRFTMSKLWGFYLPVGLKGRGKGSKALLKKFNDGVLIHDASYYNVVQLQGPEHSILSTLSMILVPSPSAHPEGLASSVVSGVTYGNAILHHVGKPVSQPIAPVTFMWRPPSHQRNEEAERSSFDILCKDPQQSGCSLPLRQLWIWLHASVFNEGYNALKLACEKQMEKNGISIYCHSLEGQLAKFDVMGLKAIQLLQKVLRPVSFVPEKSSQLKTCSTQDTGIDIKNNFILENADCSSSYSVISLTVKDPRCYCETSSEIVSVETSFNPLGGVIEQEDNRHCALSGCVGEKENLATVAIESESDSTALSDVKELWDAINGILPPVEETILCLEKQYRHLSFYCLDKKSKILNSSPKEQSSRICPILLLKNSDRKRSLIGWSIVLPLSWAKAFWVPLVTNGAHAVGLNEKRWVASELGLPFFPADFSDCSAYSCYMEGKAAATDEKMKLRPPAKRLFKVPIPPPWGSISLSIQRDLANALDTHHREESLNGEADSNLLITSDSRMHGTSPEGFVARTADTLSVFIEEFHCNNLLLFPIQPEKKSRIMKFMNNEDKFCLGLNGVTEKFDGTKVCFLRVLLHACKGGLFEEGAVVCAPHLTDVSLFTSSSRNFEGGIQIPNSSVESYFTEQCSGKWVIQIPEDPVAKKCHRWPIGFVTTGFARGSKKPVASALCGAISLARLREEQWNEMPVQERKKDIHVLVRNLRSTAYRLALATIVLEQQEEDVQFL